MGLQVFRRKKREKGEAWKHDSWASRLSWESGHLGFSPESTPKTVMRGSVGMLLGRVLHTGDPIAIFLTLFF